MREDLRICTMCRVVFDLEFRPNKTVCHVHRGEYIAIDITLSWFQQQFNFEFGLHPVNVPSLTLVIVV